MSSSLLQYAANRYSQNGEDGIVAELLKRLQIKRGWFVEFGAWDGKHMSNTYALAEDGWQGVYIEGEPDRFEDLLKTVQQFSGRLHAINAFVAAEGVGNLDELLATTPLPKEFELLSIDIDSFDWWVWKSLQNYSPQIVIIEINSSFPLGRKYVQKPDDPKGRGSSFSSMLELGREKGYSLVCHTGNMIFVRDDLVAQLKLPEEELADPEHLFMDTWVDKRSRWSKLRRSG
jgi:hypothetical protein